MLLDAKNLSGAALVTAGITQHTLDVLLFQFGQRDFDVRLILGVVGVPCGVNRGVSTRSASSITVFEFSTTVSFNDIFKFADIAGPIVLIAAALLVAGVRLSIFRCISWLKRLRK